MSFEMSALIVFKILKYIKNKSMLFYEVFSNKNLDTVHLIRSDNIKLNV